MRKKNRYQVEFRLKGDSIWTYYPGSSFDNLMEAKLCVDNTLTSLPRRVLEGRVYDTQRKAHRYYRSKSIPFKP